MNVRVLVVVMMFFLPSIAFPKNDASTKVTEEAETMTPERCASAIESFDMIWCSRMSLAESQGGFYGSLAKLMGAGLPREQGGHLYSNYMGALSLANDICATRFNGGPLTEIFKNDCVAVQLDALARSARGYLCMQQDHPDCQEPPASDAK